MNGSPHSPVNLPYDLFSPLSPVNLTYDVFDGKGESTPLVFLHGLFGSKSNFHSIAKSLVQRTGRKVTQGGSAVAALSAVS
jgi:pimeloyl-ACP methyl ester carboxylesterase